MSMTTYTEQLAPFYTQGLAFIPRVTSSCVDHWLRMNKSKDREDLVLDGLKSQKSSSNITIKDLQSKVNKRILYQG